MSPVVNRRHVRYTKKQRTGTGHPQNYLWARWPWRRSQWWHFYRSAHRQSLPYEDFTNKMREREKRGEGCISTMRVRRTWLYDEPVRNDLFVQARHADDIVFFVCLEGTFVGNHIVDTVAPQDEGVVRRTSPRPASDTPNVRIYIYIYNDFVCGHSRIGDSRYFISFVFIPWNFPFTEMHSW